MKYYICEGKPDGKYNAATKARNDVETILDRLDYKKFFISTKYGVRKNKLLKPLQFITYLTNINDWNKQFKKLKDGDTVIIQYPILNTTLFLDKIIKKYSKRINIIAIIHDLDSLRYKPEYQGKMLCKRVKKEDTNILKNCNYIIAHNEKMKEKLIEMGIDNNKIGVLQVFDYVLNKNVREITRDKSDAIIIAGNLSKEKAEYLCYLKDINSVYFNLYGVGYKKDEGEENINYMGAFSPEELLDHLEGGFGLVWDGISKETCKGGFGEYLKYNNPHKVSMYLAAEIPVIIWKEAALAKFITANNLGYAINSLEELKELKANITDEDYKDKIMNVKRISEKLRNGMFLEQAIKNIKLEEEK